MGNVGRSCTMPPLLDTENNILYVDDIDKCNLLNSFFCSISNLNDNNCNPPNLELRTNSYLAIIEFTIKEISDILKSLNIKKSLRARFDQSSYVKKHSQYCQYSFKNYIPYKLLLFRTIENQLKLCHYLKMATSPQYPTIDLYPYFIAVWEKHLKEWFSSGSMALVRRSISPKVRQSEGPLVRRFVSPKVHQSEGSLVQRSVSPKIRLS